MSSVPFDRALLDRVAAGETVFFLGAGFSLLPPELSGRQKDRRGLRETLVDNFSQTLSEAPFDIANVSVEDLVFFLREHKGIQAAAIAATLRSFLARSTELAALESYALLRSLLAARPRLLDAIITTNWDKGLEECLRGVGKINFQPIVSDNDALRYDTRHLPLLKIHGDIDDPSSIVLSSQDFDLYEKQHPRIVERLRVLLSTKYLILLGYSAADSNFRRIYRSVHFDLAGRSKGGWLIAPDLDHRERIWAPTVGLIHVPTTAKTFLQAVLSYAVKTPLGCDKKRNVKATQKAELLEPDSQLRRLAQRVRKKFDLKDVWVAHLRGGRRPNQEIAWVAAAYVESCCDKVERLAIGTGETMAALAESLDTTSFAKPVTVFSTLVMMAAPSEYRDPSHIVQKLVGRFPPGRARCFSLRLPGEAYLRDLFEGQRSKGAATTAAGLRRIGRKHVVGAMKADVIIGSARPENWFGGGDIPKGRSVPFQMLWPGREDEIEEMLVHEKAIAIHHMIPLDREGGDIMERTTVQRAWGDFGKLVQRPSVSDLRQAADSPNRVVIVGARQEKAESISTILGAGLANVAIIDDEIATYLLEER